jgi:hypothetical protein
MLQDPDISIGIMAYNEEQRIRATLCGLFAQDVFTKLSTEVIVVANGCTDDTVKVAREILLEYEKLWSIRGSARVEDLTVAGKTNAWNQFVHVFSSRRCPVLVLMDADIDLLSANTISSMVATLKNSSQAVVCVDRPVKDIEINTKRTLFQRLLVASTPELDPDNLPLCGQLYCALSGQLRQIEMPLDIAGPEDGFLRALLLTDGFTKPENKKRIVLDPDARHIFASVATLRELYKHEVWLVTGSIVNMFLFERFAAECKVGQNAMTLMKDWREKDSQWLRRYTQLQVQKRGWRLLPYSWWTRRWSQLRGLPLARKVWRLPVVLAATAVDTWVFLVSIRNVRGGRFGNWRLR